MSSRTRVPTKTLEDIIAGNIDIIDRADRLLGKVDLIRYMGILCGPANPIDTQIIVGGVPVDPRARTWVLNQLTDSVLATIVRDYLYPISKGNIFNTVVLAATDFYGAALAPSYAPCGWRIYVCLSVAGILSVRRTFGGVTVAENLNAGTALTANAAYIFDISVDVDETINFRTSVGATILKMSVWEIGDC